MQLYTDGSANPNPGPGGWSVVTVNQVLVVGHSHHATNNQMEGMAILEALKWLRGRQAVIHTDSRLWTDTINQWAPRWSMNFWRKPNGEPPANLELVQEMYMNWPQGVVLRWVRGHAGIPGNELADQWAEKARAERLGTRS
jgi:ribonuclease HI